MVESSVVACASDTRALGGDCVGRYSKVLKCSYRLPHPAVLVGDFNSHHPDWGYQEADLVGESLQEWE